MTELELARFNVIFREKLLQGNTDWLGAETKLRLQLEVYNLLEYIKTLESKEWIEFRISNIENCLACPGGFGEAERSKMAAELIELKESLKNWSKPTKIEINHLKSGKKYKDPIRSFIEQNKFLSDKSALARPDSWCWVVDIEVINYLAQHYEEIKNHNSAELVKVEPEKIVIDLTPEQKIKEPTPKSTVGTTKTKKVIKESDLRNMAQAITQRKK